MHKTDTKGVEVSVKRGIAVWISGFLTLMAALSSFGTMIYWINQGPNVPIKPYLTGEIIGELRVEVCFWISTIATFGFLGLTCIIAYRRQPPDPEIVRMFVRVGGNLAALRKVQENTAMELSEKLENNRITSEQLFKKADTDLENAKKEMLDTLEKQEKAIQKVRQDIASTVETKVNETREGIFGVLKKHETAIREFWRLSKRGTAAVEKQRTELEDMKIRLEKIEGQLVPPQPRLKSQDNTEEIRGIGPRLGEELRSIGITNVGELIMADPAVIDEKTHVSREMAERLQATAQLLMIPGVDTDDAKLLLEAGVTSRKELAAQDLVPLSRKIGEITKTYIAEGKMSEDEKPTIEEISSWIKMAKP